MVGAKTVSWRSNDAPFHIEGGNGLHFRPQILILELKFWIWNYVEGWILESVGPHRRVTLKVVMHNTKGNC